MQRKDYLVLSGVISDLTDPVDLGDLIAALCEALGAAEPNFDAARFTALCEGRPDPARKVARQKDPEVAPAPLPFPGYRDPSDVDLAIIKRSGASHFLSFWPQGAPCIRSQQWHDAYREVYGEDYETP